jgi:hypothetical protein
MSFQHIRDLEERYRAARDEAESLREARNEAIRKAVQEGAKQTEIAKETGLTRGRIAQIVGG